MFLLIKIIFKSIWRKQLIYSPKCITSGFKQRKMGLYIHQKKKKMGLYFQDPAELDKPGFRVCRRVLAAIYFHSTADDDVHFRTVSISHIPVFHHKL